MRILHIITRMDPVGGGPQEVVRLLLRYAPPGYEQEVVTLDDPASAFLQHETANIHALGGFEGYGLQSVRSTRQRKRGFSPGGFPTPHLTRWLHTNRDRFDGIILHGLWEYASLSVLRAVAGHKPYVVFAHGMLDPYFKRNALLKHLKKWLYWLPVQYWTLRRAHGVLFTTTAERDLATQSFWLYHWNPMVVALGAEAPPTDLAACTDAFFDRCPAVKGKRFLLFLGRIDPKKGCDLLIEAFATFNKPASSSPVDFSSRPDPELAEGGVERPAFLSASRPPNTVISTDQHQRAVISTDQPRNAIISTDQPLNAIISTDQPLNAVISTDQPLNAVISTDQPLNAVISTDQPLNAVISTDQRERRDPCILSGPPIKPAQREIHSDDLHLVLAGPAPLHWSNTLAELALAHGIEDRVHFLGMLTGPAKWGAFAACEAFILPSHQENFGIAVVEALACGKPVLITHPVNISADLAADGAALVEPDTLNGTTNLLTRWLALTPEQRANMATAARNSFITRYDMRMNANAILSCFEGQNSNEGDQA
jgi:glycosyltransferase involved in cell wall biosynthesis